MTTGCLQWWITGDKGVAGKGATSHRGCIQISVPRGPPACGRANTGGSLASQCEMAVMHAVVARLKLNSVQWHSVLNSTNTQQRASPYEVLLPTKNSLMAPLLCCGVERKGSLRHKVDVSTQ